jgi:hypothetical protein
MATKAKKTHTQITTRVDVAVRFHELHKRLAKNFSGSGFLDELLDVYEMSFCPECRNTLKYQRCSCKAPELT